MEGSCDDDERDDDSGAACLPMRLSLLSRYNGIATIVVVRMSTEILAGTQRGVTPFEVYGVVCFGDGNVE